MQSNFAFELKSTKKPKINVKNLKFAEFFHVVLRKMYAILQPSHRYYTMVAKQNPKKYQNSNFMPVKIRIFLNYFKCHLNGFKQEKYFAHFYRELSNIWTSNAASVMPM